MKLLDTSKQEAGIACVNPLGSLKPGPLTGSVVQGCAEDGGLHKALAVASSAAVGPLRLGFQLGLGASCRAGQFLEGGVWVGEADKLFPS